MKSVVMENKTVTPSKIICVGRNYAAHITELNNETPAEPVIFIKPNSAISNSLLFNDADAIHYEGEITYLIKDTKIYGVGVGLDLTKRAIQTNLKKKGLPWEKAKSFDNSAVFTPFVQFNGDPLDLEMTLYINDVLVQKASSHRMLTPPSAILRDITSFLTLENGDLIMSGTPKGAGKLILGDIFKVKLFAKEQQLIEYLWTVK